MLPVQNQLFLKLTCPYFI